MINTGTGFSWFFGKVEDRDDPEMMGRVRVRCHNYHTQDTTQLPTSMLPWAMIINSPLSAGIKEVGLSPTGLMVGSTVFGFFADGVEAQIPMVLGTLASIPDEHEVSQLTREINNVKKAIVNPEPDQKYAAKYPYNKVLTTEAGHVIELDDTPGAERIHIMHKSGTYIEIDEEGTRVDKTIGDHYSVIVGDENIRILGDVEVDIDGHADITCANSVSITCYGELDAKVFSDASLYVNGKITVVGQQEVSVIATGELSLYSLSSLSLETPGNMTIRAGQLNIETPGSMLVQANMLTETVATEASRITGGAASITAGGAASITAAGVVSLTGSAISTTPPIDLTPD